MKTLLVLRHGKSSWSDPSTDDHDRPLKRRGKQAAKKIGYAVRERDLLPDLILCSTARRARGTARRFQEAAGYRGEVVKTRKLYFTSVKRHLNAIAKEAGNSSDQRVMIIGHNPDLEDLVEAVTGEYVVLTTANLACIDLDVDSWSEIDAARGRLRWVIRPKDLP